MTSYGLVPDNNIPLHGPSSGAPDYSVIHNYGTDSRPLNDFNNKPFQSSLQTGNTFIGGRRRRRRRTRRVRWINKRKLHNTPNTMKRKKIMRIKNRTLTKKKKKTHSHSSYNQSFSTRKRKSSDNILKKLFFGRGEPVGYTMNTNTDSLYGALATPYNMTGYE